MWVKHCHGRGTLMPPGRPAATPPPQSSSSSHPLQARSPPPAATRMPGSDQGRGGAEDDAARARPPARERAVPGARRRGRVTGGDPTARAGIVTRLLAAAVDAGAVLLVTVALDLATAGMRFAWSPTDFSWPRPTAGLASTVFLLVAVGYLTVAWATTGRTYGARLLGLRELTTRLGLLRALRAVLRALACVLLPVGRLWCGLSAGRRSVQDIVFRAVVVYDTHAFVGVAAGAHADVHG